MCRIIVRQEINSSNSRTNWTPNEIVDLNHRILVTLTLTTAWWTDRNDVQLQADVDDDDGWALVLLAGPGLNNWDTISKVNWPLYHHTADAQHMHQSHHCWNDLAIWFQLKPASTSTSTNLNVGISTQSFEAGKLPTTNLLENERSMWTTNPTNRARIDLLTYVVDTVWKKLT